MGVRKASFDDIHVLLTLCKEMHAEGSYKMIKLSIKKLEQFFRQKISDSDSLVIVWHDKEELNGFFVADIVEYFFSEEKLAVDTLFFIRKENRKKSGAKRLLDSYFTWAESHNIREICLSTTNGVDTDKIENMYTKLGFHNSGVMYKKGD
jgi:GNAT superfamily N-acetyltransferase